MTLEEFSTRCHFMVTAGFNAAMEKDLAVKIAAYRAIDCFLSGDWGKLGDYDKAANNADLAANDGHILAKYETPAGDIYINADLTGEPEIIALLMFPEEY